MNNAWSNRLPLRRAWVSPRDPFARSVVFWAGAIGTGGTAAWLWGFSPGVESARGSLMVAKATALIAVATLLFWHVRRKDREIARLRALIPAATTIAEPAVWNSAEEDLLAALWQHPGTHSDTFACYLTDRDEKMIGHQLERLERANLVVSTVAGYFRLTAEGRNYVVQHALATRSGSLLFESAPLARGRQATHYRKREIHPQSAATRIQPPNWIPMSEDQIAGLAEAGAQAGENPEGRHPLPA